MRNKKEQIPVQRLYMDRNQNRYKNIIWITFLALLLTGGIFLVIRESCLHKCLFYNNNINRN